MGTIRKTTAQYESEAKRIKGCLIYKTYGTARKLYQRRHNVVLPRHVHVCHTCDHPLCILDAHHWLGSQKANMNDAKQKGRLQITEETRLRMRASSALRWAKESERKKASNGTILRFKDNPEAHRKSSEGHKRAYRENPGLLEINRAAQKLRWNDSILREANSKAMRKLWQNPKYKKKQMAAAKLKWSTEEAREKLKAAHNTPQALANHSAATTRVWAIRNKKSMKALGEGV